VQTFPAPGVAGLLGDQELDFTQAGICRLVAQVQFQDLPEKLAGVAVSRRQQIPQFDGALGTGHRKLVACENPTPLLHSCCMIECNEERDRDRLCGSTSAEVLENHEPLATGLFIYRVSLRSHEQLSLIVVILSSVKILDSYH